MAWLDPMCGLMLAFIVAAGLVVAAIVLTMTVLASPRVAAAEFSREEEVESDAA